jgi:hypothetical protein
VAVLGRDPSLTFFAQDEYPGRAGQFWRSELLTMSRRQLAEHTRRRVHMSLKRDAFMPRLCRVYAALLPCGREYLSPCHYEYEWVCARAISWVRSLTNDDLLLLYSF